MGHRRLASTAIARLPLWRERPAAVAVVAATGALAATLSISAMVRPSVTADDLLRWGVLLALCLGYGELSRQVEQRRHVFAAATPAIVNMSSMWTLAAALVLPPALAVTVPVVTYAHLWARSWRTAEHTRIYRVAFSAATQVLCCLAVAAVVHAGWPGSAVVSGPRALLVFAVAIPVYRVVNTTLVSAAIIASSARIERDMLLGSRSENLLDLASLVFGAITAATVVHEPWFCVLVLPAALLLQHHALLRQLVEAATRDTKTELLNAASWRLVAERHLARSAREGSSAALLVIDMDHFKLINDTFGHLTGDEVLKAVGEVLSDELRGYDALGRFGGEEFVALLPGVGEASAGDISERIRRRIEQLHVPVSGHGRTETTVRVTASIGAASERADGAGLDTLLHTADAALYTAKELGRNTVRVAAAARLRTA